jgi:protein tyrosine/serine phosphatase
MRGVMRALTAGLLLLACAAAGAGEPAPTPAPAATAAAPAPAGAQERHPRWAVPLTLEGVPNLHQITPTLFRSEQPTALGFKNLEKLGIRTVINLRAFNSDDDEVRGTNLRTARVKIFTWNIDDEHVVEVMRMLKDPANGPFLIHCQHGADRTGLMSAMYRILEEGWTPEEALDELTAGGYGYHSVWKNILRYVRSADVEKLRAAITGVGSPTAAPAATTVTDN